MLMLTIVCIVGEASDGASRAIADIVARSDFHALGLDGTWERSRRLENLYSCNAVVHTAGITHRQASPALDGLGEAGAMRPPLPHAAPSV